MSSLQDTTDVPTTDTAQARSASITELVGIVYDAAYAAGLAEQSE